MSKRSTIKSAAATSLAIIAASSFISPSAANADSPKPVRLANNLSLHKRPDTSAAATLMVPVKPLSEDEQRELLSKRLAGGMQHTFRQFANMFVVMSAIYLGKTVGLVTHDEKIENTHLQSPFPESYKPTLHEFLDAIALQTGSKWYYDATSEFIRSDHKIKKPVENIAIFAFTKTEQAKPYSIAVAKGWHIEDNGNWVQYIPPQAQVGMDIYQMGTYSSDDKAREANLLKEIPYDVAMEWAKRVKPAAQRSDLTRARVGDFDAVYFEAMVPSRQKREIRWRNWCFMSGNQCYWIVSTIFPEDEATIYPDVQAMLKSFTVKGTAAE